MVWHTFDPSVPGRELDEQGEIRVSCAELLLVKRKGVRNLYKLDKRGAKEARSMGALRARRQLAPNYWVARVNLASLSRSEADRLTAAADSTAARAR